VELVGRGFDEEDGGTDQEPPGPAQASSLPQDEIARYVEEGEPIETEAMR
jgi:hypothetical protein